MPLTIARLRDGCWFKNWDGKIGEVIENRESRVIVKFVDEKDVRDVAHGTEIERVLGRTVTTDDKKTAQSSLKKTK